MYSSYILCNIASCMILASHKTSFWKGGRVRFIATLLKSVGRDERPQGSNPCPSANTSVLKWFKRIVSKTIIPRFES